jgi:hypothetical protein
MAVPRPLLLTLLGTVLLAATFLATRNARDQAAEAPSPPAQQAAAPEPAEKSKPRADKTQAKGGEHGKAAPAKPRADKPAARPDKRPAAERASGAKVQAAVRRAMRSNRTVVLFFFQRGARDDRRVAGSVDSLGGNAVVFKDRIGNLARYGQLAISAGVTRAPSIVIIGKGRRGRLIEGYVDANTLAQRVADAR